MFIYSSGIEQKCPPAHFFNIGYIHTLVSSSFLCYCILSVEDHHLHDFILMKAQEQTLYVIENAVPMAVKNKGE
jgi:hypothetical protein